MKKFLFLILFAYTLGVPSAVHAASSITLHPSNIAIEKGKRFNVSMNIQPQNSKIYTVKLALSYPGDKLELTSFTFANGWSYISQPGYDLIDNLNGRLIKTAGFTGGISHAMIFGTAVFTAKQSGSAIISVGSDSVALDDTSANMFDGTLNHVVTVIAAPTPAVAIPTPTVVPKISQATATPLARVAIALENTKPEISLKPQPATVALARSKAFPKSEDNEFWGVTTSTWSFFLILLGITGLFWWFIAKVRRMQG